MSRVTQHGKSLTSMAYSKPVDVLQAAADLPRKGCYHNVKLSEEEETYLEKVAGRQVRSKSPALQDRLQSTRHVLEYEVLFRGQAYRCFL